MNSLDLTVQVKDFGKAKRQLASISRLLSGAVSSSIAYEATVLAGDIRRGIRSSAPGGQRFKALADSTIRMKGGKSKPLINHSDLIGSVKSEQFERGKYDSAYFVGVNRHKKGRSGQELWNIAEIHEFGTKKYNIRITPKLRGFWFAMFKAGVFNAPLKNGRAFIQHPGIPARPFLRPSFDKWKIGAEARIVARIKKRLKLTGR